MIREWAKKFIKTENAISLASGMPNTETFPFEEITITYKNGLKTRLFGDELAWSLQYGPSQGYLPLLNELRKFQKYWHKPKYNNWDVIVTSGSMDGCSKVFEMVLDIGDPIMVQTPAYDGILNALAPLAPEFIEIAQDQDGIDPQRIIKVCEERIQSGKPVPKIIYVNPTGANPTGTVLTESRRRKIYELAEKYNFLILEDDPYCFIQFEDKRPTTFIELDTVGRVIRLDSFSKIFSAGLRLGVVTARTEFIRKLELHMQMTNIHASALSQMLLYKFLNTWDLPKLSEHFNDVQNFYRKRRDIMLSLIEKHLTGLVEWYVPKGGMFVWLTVNRLKDVMELTREKCVSERIFLLPGQSFNYDRTKPDQHIRLSYSYATPEEIDKALAVLAKLIREEIAKCGA